METSYFPPGYSILIHLSIGLNPTASEQGVEQGQKSLVHPAVLDDLLRTGQWSSKVGAEAMMFAASGTSGLYNSGAVPSIPFRITVL